MPVWGIWFENAFYFSTGPRSRKARNIEKNMNCVVCPENAADAVILEGTVRKASLDSSSLREIVRNYEEKYRWKMDGLGRFILQGPTEEGLRICRERRLEPLTMVVLH